MDKIIPPRAVFELVDADQLPPGCVVDAVEKDGLFTFRILKGHMSPRLCRDLNEDHEHITNDALWKQRWNDCPNRLHPRSTDHPVAEAHWVIVPIRQHENGLVCLLVEHRRERKAFWLICESDDPTEPHMTPQCRDELNEWMRVVVGGGLWVQNEERPDPE